MSTVCADDVLEPSGTFDQPIAATRRKRDFAFADGAQVVFEMMGELLGRPQLDHRGNGFQRVEIPEQVVDRRSLGRGVADRFVQTQQGVGRRGQVLVGLSEVIVKEAVEEGIRARHR